MVQGIPRPSTKSVLKAKDNSVKRKYMGKVFNFTRRDKMGTKMRKQDLHFLPIILTYI